MAAIVQNSCRKLRSAIEDEAIMRLNFTSDLQEMLEQLGAVDGRVEHLMATYEMLEQLYAVVPDTDSVSSDADSHAGDWPIYDRWEDWQTTVNDAAYRVCNMVDELQEMTVPAAGNKTGKMLARPDNVVVEPNRREIMLEKMKEIKEKLRELHKESVQFDDVTDRIALLQAPAGATTVGREKDVQKILDRLSVCRSSREGPIILLIHGGVGVGKTTVAAMVFHENRFMCYSRVWINLSRFEEPELHDIGKNIISQLVSEGEEEMIGHGSNDDMKYITSRLHELLNGKKVLIVLHNNVWADAREWKGFKDMLSVRGISSTQVIVIATSRQYAEDDNATEFFGIQPYRLGPLSGPMCCKIFKQAATRSQDISTDKEDLERLAPQVAKFCMGIPMATQLCGNLLQNKQFREDLELPVPGYSSRHRVSGPLSLSYRSMPPNLRLCVFYCAFLIAQQTEIVKEDLIHQLIALDLIEPSGAFTSTQLAEQYLRRLVDMSFLQIAKSTQTGAMDDTRTVPFTMHIDLQEFILKSSQDVCEVVKYNRVNQFDNHCSYVLSLDIEDMQLMKPVFEHLNIRALHCLGCSKMKFDDDSFQLSRGLRVLKLHDASSMQKLPESICQLRQLGYLKLSGWSGIVTLPESIGNLVNLLHIDLSYCSGLVDLPGSFGKLINLVHINLTGCSKLKDLPESLRKLIKLVHINLSGSSALVHLPEFFGKLVNLAHINLSGCLALVDLPESMGELPKLESTNLSGCLALVNLPESFGKLPKLKHVNLSGCHKLANLPGSFGKLKNLVHINLSSCCGLSKLPGSFGELTNLAHINLSGCSVLEELPQSLGKLISLVRISLSRCSGLSTLPGSFGDLPNLLHADLSHCHGLKLPGSFGKLKKLVHLDLSFWSRFEGMQTALGGLTSLQHLNLSHPCCYRADYPHLKGLIQVLGQFSRLEHLNLSMFLNPIFCNQSEEENLEYIEFISGLSKLKYVDLSHNIFLRDLPESLADLKMLHTLDLSGCTRLKKVGKWMAEMHSLKSVVLSNMESYQFEVGTNNVINNYGQLVDVRCKELEITSLEEMKSAEPWRIRLAEKQNLQKLRLRWTASFRQSEGDGALLGELVPPHSLRYLELHGYSSTCFPSWLTTSSSISSFNLVEVTMEDMTYCSHLPPLGCLPNLQRVVLRGMTSITRIDAADLSGGNGAAFQHLSSFTIDDMDSLEEFTTTYNSGGEELLFRVMDELVVNKCPILSFAPLPPKARRLVISDSSAVMVCWPNKAGRHGLGPFSSVTQVAELVVENCWVHPSDCYLLNHLPGLRSLTIKNCNNFLSPEIIGALSSLQTLCFSHCSRMNTLPEQVCDLSSLQKLQIESCDWFQWLPYNMIQLTSLQSIHFTECNLPELPLWLGNFTSLQKLTIERCMRIHSLPPSIAELTNLKDLHITSCSSLLKDWCESEETKKYLSRISTKIENCD